MKTPDPEKAIATGLGTGVILHRDKLGKEGRALYQADFYIPPDGHTAPSLAVLAMAPLRKGRTRPQEFYRFGITRNKSIYFSNVVASKKAAEYYVEDRELFKKLPRPAWHRFAIVFEGESTIRCYIDGQEPAFSPIEHAASRELQVGIMLAEKTNSYICYVDNMSIQWTENDVPLPDSPYASTWTDGPEVFNAPQVATQIAPAPTHLGSAIPWQNTETGARMAQAQNKLMLVNFVAPRIRSTESLERMLTNNQAANAFVSQYVPVKIDVNQLMGGTLAARYRILRVPTLIVMDPSGREISRVAYTGKEDWPTLQKKLAR
jgi:hypothetical protein